MRIPLTYEGSERLSLSLFSPQSVPLGGESTGGHPRPAHRLPPHCPHCTFLRSLFGKGPSGVLEPGCSAVPNTHTQWPGTTFPCGGSATLQINCRKLERTISRFSPSPSLASRPPLPASGASVRAAPNRSSNLKPPLL